MPHGAPKGNYQNKAMLFYFLELIYISIFLAKRFIDILDPENQPGSGSVKIQTGTGSRALGFTDDVRPQKYENRALDPNLAKTESETHII